MNIAKPYPPSSFLKALIGFLCLSLEACIEPITIPVDQNQGFLVVDGLITDQAEPYQVRLSRSRPFESVNFELDPVVGAEVSVADNQGNVIRFTEVEAGLYQSIADDGFGEIGKSYTLSIRTSTGQTYRSTPETIQASPPIERAYFELESVPMLRENADGSFTEFEVRGLQARIDVTSQTDLSEYFRYDWQELYEFREFNIVDISSLGLETYPPFLPPAEVCFLENDSRNFLNISETASRQNGQLRAHPIFFNTSFPKLSIRYSLLIRQFSLSEGAFRHFELIQQQQESAGFLFDPTPAQITGNIFPVNEGEEVVLGYFQASSVQEKRIFIARDEVPPSIPVEERCQLTQDQIDTALGLAGPGCQSVECIIQVVYNYAQENLPGGCFDCNQIFHDQIYFEAPPFW